MKRKIAIVPRGYAAFLAALKARIAAARVSATRTVNRELVLLYWDIGSGIVEKQKIHGWGESVVEKLAKDLQRAFPDMRGFSDRNLRDMKRMYLAYSDEAFWRQPVAKLGASSISRQPVAKLDLASDTKKKRPAILAQSCASSLSRL